MPGTPHEVLLLALRDRPELLRDLLSRTAGVKRPGPIEVVDAATRFAKSIEVRPDLVFRGRRPRWIVFELQNRIDANKRRSWPLAVSLLCAREKVMGEVVVLTASRSVASWAKRVGHQRGEMGTRFELTPIVIYLAGKRVDALLDPARPELSLFAAWAMHARRGPEATRVVARAVELIERLPKPLRDAQERAIFAVLSEPLLALLQKASMNPDAIPERPAARRLRLFLARQREESRAEGEAKGQVLGKQKALLSIFEARGLVVTAPEREQIVACVDSARLDVWITLAVAASSVRDVLAVTQTKRAAPKRRTTPKHTGARRKTAA